jgi:hypothetical protein
VVVKTKTIDPSSIIGVQRPTTSGGTVKTSTVKGK